MQERRGTATRPGGRRRLGVWTAVAIFAAAVVPGCPRRQGETGRPGAGGGEPAGGAAGGAGVVPAETWCGERSAAPTEGDLERGFGRFYRYEAPRYEFAAEAPSLPVPLEGIDFPEALARRYGLDEAAREVLSRNGFVVTAGPGTATDRLPDVYEDVRGLGVPVFVTADTALHLYHLVFDALLMTIEERHLVPALVEMVDALRAQALAVPVRDLDAMAEAAWDVLAVCHVVRRLLDDDAEVDPAVAERVAQEVRLIEDREGFRESPVFVFEEDYTQYVPRGHYTRTATLARYFKAMMWIGRMSFLLKARGDPAPGGLVPVERARRLATAAALIAAWLPEAPVRDGTARDLWDRIYDVTAFFAGFSDDLTPVEVLPIAAEVLGRGRGALGDPETVDRMRAAMAALRSPRIYSGTGGGALAVDLDEAGDPDAWLEGVAATVGVRLMGQRYTPDADVMGRLVFPVVGAPSVPIGGAGPFTLVLTQQGPTRGFSRGLDVMALLGAPTARPILDRLADSAYHGYDEALAAACDAFPPASDPLWHSTLYWSWLEVLRDYVRPRARPSQGFETSAAWHDRTLTAALASWAQLRHDTILYVKQPYVMMTTSARPEPPPPPPPQGLVEPHPEFFARLAALNDMTLRGLDELGVLPESAADTLRRFGDVLGRLRDLAIKEIEDRPLDEADNAFLDAFAATCRDLLDRIAALNVPPPDPRRDEPPGESAVDTRTSRVADVMTNPEAGTVLEEGTGRVDALTVVFRAPGRGDLMIGVGPVLTYYEFRWPMTDRLTDEKWREILGSAEPPPRPPWICSFRSPCP